MFKKLSAEFIGTFVLVFGGCGGAVLAAAFPEHGIHFTGVALAFGLAMFTMVHALGGISGGHFNPAISLGLAVADRFEWSELVPYWIAQTLGGSAAAAILYLIASGQPGWTPGGFASNGYGANSPGGYNLISALAVEVTLSAIFLVVILGVTRRGAPAGLAPLAIGLALTLIHLVALPVTNASVNPARSTAVAFFAANDAVDQLWVFWVAPLVGGALGALIWDHLLESD